jgi:hypothetical protein
MYVTLASMGAPESSGGGGGAMPPASTAGASPLASAGGSLEPESGMNGTPDPESTGKMKPELASAGIGARSPLPPPLITAHRPDRSPLGQHTHASVWLSAGCERSSPPPSVAETLAPQPAVLAPKTASELRRARVRVTRRA